MQRETNTKVPTPHQVIENRALVYRDRVHLLNCGHVLLVMDYYDESERSLSSSTAVPSFLVGLVRSRSFLEEKPLFTSFLAVRSHHDGSKRQVQPCLMVAALILGMEVQSTGKKCKCTMQDVLSIFHESPEVRNPHT